MWSDIRYAGRSLVKNSGFTLVAVVTLALGIGANTLIFSLIKGAYFEGLPYPRGRDILTIGALFSKGDDQTTPISGPEFVALKEQSHTISHVTALIGGSFNLTGEGDAVRFRGLRASGDLFPLINVPPLLGRVFAEEEQRPGNDRVVVISYQLWQRALGGAAGVVGREIRLNDVGYTIIGVMPPRFRYGDCDIWVPLSLDLARQDRSVRNVYCHARLGDGFSINAVNADLARVAHNIEKDFGSVSREYIGWNLRARPLIDGVLRNLKPALAILTATVGCVLLIACANISNLQLARNVVREKEITIRLALGARRSDIIRQLLIESGLIAFLGGVAGVILAWWSLQPVLRLVPYSYIPIEANVTVDEKVLFVTLGVTVVTAILSGLMPAWKASRLELNDALRATRGGAGTPNRHRRARSVLVISQVALTFILLIVSALTVKSFARLHSVDTGFDPTRLFKIETVLPATRYSDASAVTKFYETLLGKLRGLPGIESVSAATVLPLASFPDRQTIAIEGMPENAASGVPAAEQRQITPGYLTTLGMSLRQGRDLDEHDTSTSLRVALVNETFVKKYLPAGNPIGRRLRLAQDENENAWLTIVGVVKDVRQLGITDPVMPEVFRPHSQAPAPSRRMALVFRTRLDPAALIKSVRAVVKAQDSSIPLFEAEPMEQFIAHAFGGAKFTVFLSALFGLVALGLTLTGIYGVVAYFVAHRTGEIGIRMALGAQRHHVLRLILAEGVSMVASGVAIGVLVALATTRVLQSLLFEVSSTDPSVYLLVGSLLALATLVASYLPARAALRLNPVEALRYE